MWKVFQLMVLFAAYGVSHASENGQDAIREYVQRVNAGDWVHALALVDQTEVREMRSQFSKGIDTRAEARERAFKGLSLDEINKLSDSQYVGKALIGTYNPNNLGFDFSGPNYTILGFVVETPETVHALARVKTNTPGETLIQVVAISAERQNGGWVISMRAKKVARATPASSSSIEAPPRAPPPVPPSKK
jgi:hypothetical protein